jgi:ribonuclease HI
MDHTTPDFLLFSHVDRSGQSGQWQFVLRSKDGSQRLEAQDAEADLPVERLELLTVVRALESLDQPSRVTLVECSDYVWTGVRYGLSEWRSNDWRWEFFGQMVPVKNSDLWQRLDRALEFHDVECRRRRFDPPHSNCEGTNSAESAVEPNRGIRRRLSDWLKYAAWVAPLNLGRRVRAAGQSVRRWSDARTDLRSPRFAHNDVDTSASMTVNG